MAFETCLAAGKLTIAVRETAVSKALKVKEEIILHCKDAQIEIITYEKIAGHFDVLINSTPVGMYPDSESCPVGDEIINSCDKFFDAIYNPVETVLIKKAKSMGKTAVGGMAMLVYQAVVAHEIWDDVQYNENDINKLIKDMEDKVMRDFK